MTTIENRVDIAQRVIIEYRQRNHQVYHNVDPFHTFMHGTVGLLQWIKTGELNSIGVPQLRSLIREYLIKNQTK
ncbi:MAG: hypothetical protein WC444_05770 [Candidatus Paceibacterota bacterium]